MDCGKAPLSMQDIGIGMWEEVKPKILESIAKDIVLDILSKPPDRIDNLPEAIKFLIDYVQMYPHLNNEAIVDWVRDASIILRDLK
jgi:hypothetical protein